MSSQLQVRDFSTVLVLTGADTPPIIPVGNTDNLLSVHRSPIELRDLIKTNLRQSPTMMLKATNLNALLSQNTSTHVTDIL